jgi:hypothetical protein
VHTSTCSIDPLIFQETPPSTEPNPQPAQEIKEDLDKAVVPSMEETALESKQLESEWKDSPQQTVTEGSEEDVHSEIIKKEPSDEGKDEEDPQSSELEIPMVDS